MGWITTQLSNTFTTPSTLSGSLITWPADVLSTGMTIATDAKIFSHYKQQDMINLIYHIAMIGAASVVVWGCIDSYIEIKNSYNDQFRRR
jgi:hypothetical protein